jgi:hypothetical protein
MQWGEKRKKAISRGRENEEDRGGERDGRVGVQREKNN